jgi:hypothetical protein
MGGVEFHLASRRRLLMHTQNVMNYVRLGLSRYRFDLQRRIGCSSHSASCLTAINWIPRANPGASPSFAEVSSSHFWMSLERRGLSLTESVMVWLHILELVMLVLAFSKSTE